MKVFCVLGVISILFFYPSPLFSEGTTLNITVLYATKSSDFDSSSSFSESLENPNNTSFDISFPENSLSSGDEIRMRMESTTEVAIVSSRPLPSDKLAANTFYNLSFIKISDSSSIASFDQLITLTFHYTDSDITGIDESTLVARRWDGSGWISLSNNTVDTDSNIVTATTQQFSFFGLIGDASVSSPTCGDGSCNGSETCSTCSTDCGSCGGGGGGGGGGYVAPITSVIFEGRAYPLSKVAVLKDGQIAISTIAGPDARFEVSLSGLTTGNYAFAVYGEDNKESRSSLFTFSVYITSGATTKVSGIFIAPTIAVDKSEVRRGENITIFGQSAPKAEVTVAINSGEEFFGKAVADSNGAYLYNFDTTQIEKGQHLTKSKAAIEGAISPFGKIISFIVGTKNIVIELPRVVTKSDLNGDKRVNLIDFSIAAYWYKRDNPPLSVDLNGDGKVNLIDFSIMAYYWTG